MWYSGSGVVLLLLPIIVHPSVDLVFFELREMYMCHQRKILQVGPKIKFYLFPLTRPTLKKWPYPKDFISIFSQELFFKINWQYANLKN